MNMTFERTVGVAAGLAAGLALLYYMYGPRMQQQIPDASEPPAEAEAPAPPVREPPPAANTGPRYPVPAAPAAARAPNAAKPPADLAVSDGAVRGELADVFGAEPIEAFLISHRVVQNIVTTLDSLDRDPVPIRFRAIDNVADLPTVDRGDDERITLSEANGDRYAYLIGALEQAEAPQIVAVYLRYYPIFERAYHELGYPGAHFNDRVVAIIDHLLETPDVPGPIELVRPKVLYQFADPQLEERSSGQKIMIRIGPENATVVKRKLREIRAILASRGAAPAAAGREG